MSKYFGLYRLDGPSITEGEVVRSEKRVYYRLRNLDCTIEDFKDVVDFIYNELSRRDKHPDYERVFQYDYAEEPDADVLTTHAEVVVSMTGKKLKIRFYSNQNIQQLTSSWTTVENVREQLLEKTSFFYQHFYSLIRNIQLAEDGSNIYDG